MADFSTYARVVLGNSESIRKLIVKYISSTPIANIASPIDLSNLLLISNQQLEDALINPQNAIKLTIKAYAELIKAHRELIQLQYQAYNQQLAIEGSIQELRDKFAHADKAGKELINKSIKELEKYYKAITQIQTEFKQLEEEITGLESNLNELTVSQDQEWDSYREGFLNELVQNLENLGVPLTDMEKNEVKTQETWPEVIKRFRTLSLEFPDYIDLNEVNYNTYFELKSFLAIHSSLSRRMLPHSAEDIAKVGE